MTSPFSAGPGDDDAVDDAVEDAGGTTPFASEPTTGSDENPDDEPDAVARGWVRMGDEAQRNVLFVLAGSSLGVGSIGNSDPPTWIDLSSVTNLDAIGDAGRRRARGRDVLRGPSARVGLVGRSRSSMRRRGAPRPMRRPVTGPSPDRRPASPTPDDVDPLHGVPDLGSTTFFEHAPLHRRRVIRARARGRHLPQRLPGPGEEAQALHGDAHRGGDRGRRADRASRSGSAGTSSRRSRPRTPTRRGSA